MGRIGKYFDFTDASLKGDPKWAQAAKWSGWAGPLVLTLVVLSIIEIVLGVLIIVGKDNDLTLYGLLPLFCKQILTFNQW